MPRLQAESPIPLEVLLSGGPEKQANPRVVQRTIIRAVMGEHETRNAHMLSRLGVRSIQLGGIENSTQVSEVEAESIMVRTTLFQREVRQEGHEVGQLLALAGIPFFTEEGELVLRVNTQKGLLADGFRVGKVSEETRQRLSQYEGSIPIGALIRVGLQEEKPEDEPGDHRYFAAQMYSEVILPTVNRPDKQLEDDGARKGLPRGAKAGISGTVISMYDDDPYGKGHTHTYNVITPSQEMVTFYADAADQGLTYRRGVSPGTTGKPIKEGDKIRVSVVVDDDVTHTHRKKLVAGENEPVLDAPGEARQTDDISVRRHISRLSERVKNDAHQGRYDQARKAFAEARHFELLEGEAVRLISATASLPDLEKPFYANEKDISEKLDIHSLEADFGVLVESMTEAEFITFAHKVGKGEARKRKPRNEEASKPTTDPHVLTVGTIVKEQFSEEAAFILFSEAVDARMDRLERNPNMVDRQAFNEVVHGLSTLSLPAATKKLAEVFLRTMEPGDKPNGPKPYYLTEFDSSEGSEGRIPEPLRKIADTTSKGLWFSIERFKGNAEYLIPLEEQLEAAAAELAMNLKNINTRHLTGVLNVIGGIREVKEKYGLIPPKANTH